MPIYDTATERRHRGPLFCNVPTSHITLTKGSALVAYYQQVTFLPPVGCNESIRTIQSSPSIKALETAKPRVKVKVPRGVHVSRSRTRNS